MAFALLFSEQLHTWHMLSKCHQILMKTYRAIFSISKSQLKYLIYKICYKSGRICNMMLSKKTTLLRWRQRTVKYLIFQVLSDAQPRFFRFYLDQRGEPYNSLHYTDLEICGFGHIYWRSPWVKASFFVQC